MAKILKLQIPEDDKLLQAIGRVSASHAQLELTLQYCIKTLASLPIKGALNATSHMRVSDLRERIKKLFKEINSSEIEKTKLDALLSKAKQLSEKRNNLIHRPWKIADTREYEVKSDDHTWGQPPTREQLNLLADEILDLAKWINQERLNGFIQKAVAEKKK